MLYLTRLIALTCIAILTIRTQTLTAADKKLKVHILGDSITQSKRQNYCWRYWLWLKLKENDQLDLVDFVGSSSGPGSNWDCQHDGHWGWSTKKILGGLKSWAPKFKADINLIHLGTNDMKIPEVPAIVDVFRDVISLLRTHNDSVGIVIGQIPSWSTGRDEKVAAFNKELLTLKALDTKASPIWILDLTPGYDRTVDNYDNVHPNESGAKKYAKHFYPALIDMVNYQNGVPTGISILSVRDNPVNTTGHWYKINGQLFISLPAFSGTQRGVLDLRGKRVHRNEIFSR